MPFSMTIEESRMSCISCLFSYIASYKLLEFPDVV